MQFDEWVRRYPEAAGALRMVLHADAHVAHEDAAGRSEAWAQQQVRLNIAKMGGLAWRNNVGATKAKEVHQCPSCKFKFEVKSVPVRYGLANDSAQLNEKIKSSDVIGILPRLIQPQHVGLVLGQFVAVEVKKPGWRHNPNDPHEIAQGKFLSLCADKGAAVQFSTGEITL